MSKSKILFVVNGHLFTAKHRLPLIEMFQKMGCDVKVIVPRGSEVIDFLMNRSVDVVAINLSRRGLGVYQNLQSLYQLIRAFKSLSPNVVVLSTIKPVLFGGIAARLMGVPRVISIITGLGHTFNSYSFRDKCFEYFILFLYRLFFRNLNNTVVFQNDEDMAILCDKTSLDGSRCKLVRGSGVDTVKFSPAIDLNEVPVVLMVSRLIYEKGVHDFVAAAKIIYQRGVKAKFVIVGEPDSGNPMSIDDEQIVSWVKEDYVEANFLWGL